MPRAYPDPWKEAPRYIPLQQDRVILTGMSRNIPTRYNDSLESDVALARAQLARAGSIELKNVENFSPILSAYIIRSSNFMLDEALIYAV